MGNQTKVGNLQWRVKTWSRWWPQQRRGSGGKAKKTSLRERQNERVGHAIYRRVSAHPPGLWSGSPVSEVYVSSLPFHCWMPFWLHPTVHIKKGNKAPPSSNTVHHPITHWNISERERVEVNTMSFCSSLSSPQSISLFSKPFHGDKPVSVSLSSRIRASADVPDFLSADW